MYSELAQFLKAEMKTVEGRLRTHARGAPGAADSPVGNAGAERLKGRYKLLRVKLESGQERLGLTLLQGERRALRLTAAERQKLEYGDPLALAVDRHLGRSVTENWPKRLVLEKSRKRGRRTPPFLAERSLC